MKSELYEMYAELGDKKFEIDDPELAELHRLAANHIEEAIVVSNDEDRLNAERDYELEVARQRLDEFEEVSGYEKPELDG